MNGPRCSPRSGPSIAHSLRSPEISGTPCATLANYSLIARLVSDSRDISDQPLPVVNRASYPSRCASANHYCPGDLQLFSTSARLVNRELIGRPYLVSNFIPPTRAATRL
jgi:hypothetical protein